MLRLTLFLAEVIRAGESHGRRHTVVEATPPLSLVSAGRPDDA